MQVIARLLQLLSQAGTSAGSEAERLHELFICACSENISSKLHIRLLDSVIDYNGLVPLEVPFLRYFTFPFLLPASLILGRF